MSVAEFELASDDRAYLREISRKIRAPQGPQPEVTERVREIIQSVRDGGDSSLLKLIEQYDGATVEPASISVSRDQMAQALDNIDLGIREAIESSANNVRRVAEAGLGDANIEVLIGEGHKVSQRAVPVRYAAAYVPGGRAPYPSTVVMTCVPAAVAGVEKIAICSPPDAKGQIPDVTLAAASICGAEEAFCMGGAHAIAALALGTESIEPVDLIVGPGNRYVQEAKRQLFGQVGIDSIAGPSELMVVADSSCDRECVAYDLIAQSEHGPDSLLVLAGPDRGVLEEVIRMMEKLKQLSPTATDAPMTVVKTDSNKSALGLAEELAPEHLEMACSDPEALAKEVTRAGCVFLGKNGATAFGDYLAGSNHVLPTSGSARFSSTLGPSVFMRMMSLVSLSDEAVDAILGPAEVLARAEGFDLHAESMLKRSHGLSG